MKFILRTLALVSLIGVAGCSATVSDTDQVRFKRIAGSLEPDGSCYFISTARQSGTGLEKQLRENELRLWDSPLPHKNKVKFQRLISGSELAARKAGLHEINGWGGSSKKISGTSPELFRNKIRILTAPESRGVLWHLTKQKNGNLEKYFYDLPDDTFFAAVFDLNPAALLRFIEADKKIFPTVTTVCKMLADQTPKALAEHLSGIWKIVVVCDEKNDISNLSGIHIALSIPDKGGKVFSVLSQRMRGLPETRVDLKKQFIKLERVPGQMCIPFICKGKDSLILCSSPLAGERTKVTHPAGKLSGVAETYRKYLSPEGVGLVFCKNPFQFNAFSGKIDTITVSPALAVVKKLPDGLEIEEISPWDLNTRFILSSLSLAFKLVSDKVNSPPRPRKKAQPGTRAESPAAPAAAPKAPAAAPKAPAAAPKAPAQNLCRSGIGKVGKKLLEYTARKKVWPPHGIAGLRELIRQKQLTAAEMTCPLLPAKKAPESSLSYANCHYLYFGQPAQNSPKSPLLMEFPFMHKEYFSIFYTDGTVGEIRLTGHRNVRRAVSFLHTVNSYEEEEFMRLMQIAAEFDKILE